MLRWHSRISTIVEYRQSNCAPAHLVCKIVQRDSVRADCLLACKVMQVGPRQAFSVLASRTRAVRVDDVEVVRIFPKTEVDVSVEN